MNRNGVGELPRRMSRGAKTRHPHPAMPPFHRRDPMLSELPLDQVHPNPDQPRKDFDQGKLRELAASISEHGLMQPIIVRPDQAGYVIVAGERRYRAHKLVGLPTIAAQVVEIDGREAAEQAIIENLQRVDISPLEEAHAYRKMLDDHGYTPEQLARRLGIKQPWRITERTALLKLQPGYRKLLATGQISPSQATELARLDDRGQDTLFRAIRTGKCPTYETLRATANALVEAEAQTAIFDQDAAPAATDQDVKLARGFERKIEQVAALLNAGIRDNEVVAIYKVNPTRAGTLADRMAEMRKSLKAIELALRQVSVQMDFVNNSMK